MRIPRGTPAIAIVGTLLGLALLALYAYTTAPEVTFQDSGELITAAYTLGIPHPPGSPAWCLPAHLFTLLPVGSVAYRVNLMSALFGALTCALVYCFVASVVMDSRGAGSRLAHVCGIISALTMAQSTSFWEESIQAELYTMNACFLAATLYLFHVFAGASKRGMTRRAERALLVLAFLFGLGAANHLSILYCLPPACIAILCVNPALIKKVGLILRTAVMGLTGTLLYLYLPIRSLADPPIDSGNPETFSAFMRAMQRKQWGDFTFTDQSQRYLAKWLTTYDFRGQLGLVCLLLACVGLVGLAVRRKAYAALVAGYFLFYGIAMLLMQAGTPALLHDLHFVRVYDLREFHIPLYLVVCICAGIGIPALCAVLESRLPSNRARPAILAGLGSVLLLLAVRAPRVFAASNYRHYDKGYRYGHELLAHVPENGWIIPGSDNANFILAYMKFCAGERPDVFLLVPSPSLVTELVRAGERDNPALSSAWLVDRVRANPDSAVKPLYHQPGSPARGTPGVFFAGAPPFPFSAANIHPKGPLFALGHNDARSPDSQWRYWKTLLQKPGFALRPDSKRGFRMNMEVLLRNHARWHYVHQEYALSAYLYARALEYIPVEEPELLADAALSAARAGYEQDVVQALCRRALSLDPHHQRALSTLGVSYAQSGDYEQAIHCFETLLARYPDDHVTVQNLARARRDRARQAPNRD